MKRLAIAILVTILWTAVGHAQMTGSPVPGYKREPGMTASAVPAALREIGFDQHIGSRLPLDTFVRDEAGRPVPLSTYFGGRPVILVFAYYSCPMLCSLVFNGLASAVGVLSLEPGRDFDVVTISFDPHDNATTAAAKKTAYLERYRHAGAAEGSHFLTADPASIEQLTKASGFRYVWDASTQQFAHPTGIIVVTPDGRLARYLFGIDYGPRDLRLALVEASAGRVGTAVDSLLLYCYHYDPMTGRYGFIVMRALRVAGVATVLALTAFIGLLIRRDRRRTSGTPDTLGTTGTLESPRSA
jgi:protein SCO1/2